MANDWATLSFAEIFWMTAESLVMVTVPSVISWVLVEIQSIVEALASGWGATRYLPSHAGVSVFVVKVMDSPGFSQVLVGGACSRIRLHVILGSFTVTVSVCDTVIALDLIPVL